MTETTQAEDFEAKADALRAASGGGGGASDVEKRFEELKDMSQEDISTLGAEPEIHPDIARSDALNEVLNAPEGSISIDDKLRFLAAVNRAYVDDQYNDSYMEPLRYTPEQTYMLQRKLAAAGYIKLENAKQGFYDEYTRKAMSSLIEDARLHKRDVGGVLNERAGLSFPSTMEANPEIWEAQQKQAYVQAWRGQQAAPPGYFADKKHMNPAEVVAYEQAKATWKSSVGKQQADELQTAFGPSTPQQGGI